MDANLKEGKEIVHTPRAAPFNKWVFVCIICSVNYTNQSVKCTHSTVNPPHEQPHSHIDQLADKLQTKALNPGELRHQ